MNFTTVSSLSDDALLVAVAHMSQSEREASAALIVHLGELWARRLHERAGYSSLFTYCVEVLHLSESEAYDRMKAARAARRYPEILDLLATSRISLTTIRLLAPHLTPQNHAGLFSIAEGKSKRDVQRLLAERFPHAPVAFSVRKLPAARLAQGTASPSVPGALGADASGGDTAGNTDRSAAPLGSAQSVHAVGIGGAAAGGATCGKVPVNTGSTSIPARARPLVQPLAADRFQITFTADAATCEKLEMARDLLRHAIPNGDAGQVLARALDVFVETLVRQKYAAHERPRGSRGQASASRNIPAEVKRKVHLRDGGRCAYVAASGRRCGERSLVEFHHVLPYAAGGMPTVENVALRCRTHNQYDAAVFFGASMGSGAVRETGPAYGPVGCVNAATFSFRNEKLGPPGFPSTRPTVAGTLAPPR